MIWTRRGFWPSVAAVVAQVAVVSSAQAQQGAGVLTGKIEDAATKAPIADAVVTVTSPALQGEQLVVTDSTGLYRMPNLPPGVYTIRVEKETFKPYAREEIALRADATLRIDVPLMPEAVQAEEIVVVAKNPTVDIGSSTVGQTVDTDFNRRLALSPVGGIGGAVRSFESVAEVTPGAKVDDYGVSIAGTTSPENQYVVDGTSTNSAAFGTNAAPLSTEFTSQVNIITGGYMPEYGKATGGTINVVTKQGSNEFHGGFWGNMTPGFLEGSRTRIRAIGDAIEVRPSLNNVMDAGFDIGGPIIKDKLWFYTGFMAASSIYNADRTINARELDAEGNVIKDGIYDKTREVQSIRLHSMARNYQAFGKLTYTVNPQNRINLTVYGLPSESRTAGARGSYNAVNGLGDSNIVNGTLRWTSETEDKKLLVDTTLGLQRQTISDRAVDGSRVGEGGLAAESQVIWRRTKSHPITDFEGDLAGLGCDPAGTAQAKICPVRNYATGGPGQLSEKTIDRVQGRSVVTYLAEAFGHHVAKAGLDVEYLRYSNLRGYSGDRVYRESTGGGSFSDYRQYGYLQGPDDPVVLRTLKWTTKSISTGGFLQDSWSIADKVTLNVGLRYDTQLLYGGDGAVSLALPNQWSPRVGVIYDPTQQGRAKIYGNWARYYESVPLNIMDRAGSSEPTITSQRPKASCDPRDINQQQTTCVDDSKRISVGGNESPDRKWIITGAGKTPVISDIKPQSTDEVVGGAEYDVITSGRVGLFYVRRWMNEVVEDVSRDEAQTYLLGNPGYGLLRDFPKPERNYDGATVFFTKTFGDNWLAQLSYTISYLRGNYAGLFRPETGQLDPNINSDFDLRSLMANRYGPLPGDNTHAIKLFGARDWDLGDRFTLNTGLSLRANSGGPTNVLGSHPIYGGDEAFILPRGAGDAANSGERLPWNFRVDPKVAFGMKWSKEQTVVFSVDAINVFNFQAVTAKDETYTNADVFPLTNGNLPADLKTNPSRDAFDKNDINPNFGQPTAYQQPRQIRFGIRTTF